MSNNSLIRRLEALERAITVNPPELIFCWTRLLAQRIEPVLPKDRNYRLVCYPLPDEDGRFEAELRERNPQEAARLDALLRGEILPEDYPAVTPNGAQPAAAATEASLEGYRLEASKGYRPLALSLPSL